MLENKSIGIFDSGVGGLTVLNSLQSAFPMENFIYVGDNQNAPWGNKDKDSLYVLTQNIINFLLTQNIKCLILACNTTYSYFYKTIQDQLDIPVINLLEESCQDAISTSINKRICIMATQGTINNHNHLDFIKYHQPSAEVFELPCPDLVQYIEDNSIDIPECQDKLRQYVLEFTKFNADTLVYACSHFPYLDTSIRRYCSPELRTINPAISVRHSVKNCLDEIGYASNNLSEINCYITGSKDKFTTFIASNFSLNSFKVIKQEITPNLNIISDIPIILCVSTDDNIQQSINRSGGKFGNKGSDSAEAALKMILINSK